MGSETTRMARVPLFARPQQKTIPHIMMGAYGLNARFQHILKGSRAKLEDAEGEALDHVTADEKDAMEVGLSKGYRKQLFGEIEKATARFAREVGGTPTKAHSLPLPSTGHRKP